MADIIKIEGVKEVIITLRGENVILDSDVAKLYGVETRIVNQAVKNNPEKFPKGYVLELTKDEAEFSKSKFLILNEPPRRGKNIKYLPKAFTERGLYMLATILKSPIATQTTLAIVETFAKVRELKREIQELNDEGESPNQSSRIKKIGEFMAELMMPELRVEETESSMEVNVMIGKFTYKVKKVNTKPIQEKFEKIIENLMDLGWSDEDIKNILK